MKRLPRTVLVRKAKKIDLELGMFKLEEGQTYYDDGTTVFHVYIEGGLADGSLEEARREHKTITVGVALFKQ